MAEIKKNSLDNLSKNFAPPSFSENNKNDFSGYRKLKNKEIELLIKNNNYSEDWNSIYVHNNFNPALIKNSEFYGKVNIGAISPNFLEYHDLKLPVGIYNSTIISCDIKDNAVIKNVAYLSHYIISEECILFNIQEMLTSDHAKFGNGILKEGEDEVLRIWLEICNENEGRKVLPFESMITADAYLWSKFRDDDILIEKFKEITEKSFSSKRGYYGSIGEKTVIKNTRIIKDTNVGNHAYIKGANKIKNTTILSSKEEPSQIGEGVELVNGIVGYGSKIFYGSKAVRFITGRNTQLKYGARLINSILGDNSTVSCCELLNNLIFPFHEQHHNNSFLIAATTFGQTNIAAGATIGSNHNSRTPDGEIIAGRGFWPGLCTSFKHNSKFVSFVLVAKGDYDMELNIEYPFSLLSIDKKDYSICITPAYWFMYNMYAMARNTSKFNKRDKRKVKIQNIETEYLAPDSVSEILNAIDKLNLLLKAKNFSKVNDVFFNIDKHNDLILIDETQAKKTSVKIIKPFNALKAYYDMCLFFVFNNLLQDNSPDEELNLNPFLFKINNLYKKSLFVKWHNIGGQLIPEEKLEELKNSIKDGSLKTWDQIHAAYNNLWNEYPEQKARYTLYVFEKIINKKIDDLSKDDWKRILIKGIEIHENVYKLSYSSRKKDYNDPFRDLTFSNEKEKDAVLGKIEDNDFLIELKIKTDKIIEIMKNYLIAL